MIRIERPGLKTCGILAAARKKVKATIRGTKDVGDRGPNDGLRVVGGYYPGTFDSEDNS